MCLIITTTCSQCPKASYMVVHCGYFAPNTVCKKAKAEDRVILSCERCELISGPGEIDCDGWEYIGGDN